ncbi:MAG: hypothetical protein AAGE52_21305 [Myxococcota bacterium]
MRLIPLLLLASCFSGGPGSRNVEIRDAWGNRLQGPYAPGSLLRAQVYEDGTRLGDAQLIPLSSDIIRIDESGAAYAVGDGSTSVDVVRDGRLVGTATIRVQTPTRMTIEDDSVESSGGIFGLNPFAGDLRVATHARVLLHARYWNRDRRIYADQALEVVSDGVVAPSLGSPRANQVAVFVGEEGEYEVTFRLGEVVHEVRLIAVAPDAIQLVSLFPTKAIDELPVRAWGVQGEADGVPLAGTVPVEWSTRDRVLGRGLRLNVNRRDTDEDSPTLTVTARTDILETSIEIVDARDFLICD